MSSTVGPAGSTRFSTRRCGRASLPRDHVVHRAVPPVDRAVVQAQLRQLRGAPGGQFGQRILVGQFGQQRREVADVLLEQVEDRGDPALAEPDPRPHALGLQLVRVGCRWPGRTARCGFRPTIDDRRSTANSRRAPAAGRPAPARRSSCRRTPRARPEGAIAYWCKRIPGRSSRRAGSAVPGRLMSIRMSSPRAVKIESLSA